jgi:hypothetical protein
MVVRIDVPIFLHRPMIGNYSYTFLPRFQHTTLNSPHVSPPLPVRFPAQLVAGRSELVSHRLRRQMNYLKAQNIISEMIRNCTIPNDQLRIHYISASHTSYDIYGPFTESYTIHKFQISFYDIYGPFTYIISLIYGPFTYIIV